MEQKMKRILLNVTLVFMAIVITQGNDDAVEKDAINNNGARAESSQQTVITGHGRKARETFELFRAGRSAGNSADPKDEDKNRIKAKNTQFRHKCKRRGPIVINLEAIAPEDPTKPFVGYDKKGNIQGEWNMTVHRGKIGYDNTSKLIVIQKTGVYRAFGSIRYRDNNTTHSMGHCLIIKRPNSTMTEKRCVAASATYRYHETKKDWWINSQSKYVAGIFDLGKGTTIGVGMYMGTDHAASNNSILFRPEECYFGAYRIP